MPFTDADGNPITCHTCPFKINTDCTAMPPTPSTNALTMQVWNYPPARNPCIRHPALGGMKLPEGVTAGLEASPAIIAGLNSIIDQQVQDSLLENIQALQRSGRLAFPTGDTGIQSDGDVAPTPQPISDDSPVPPEIDPGIAGNVPDKPPTRSRASRATARPAEGGNA